MTPTTRACIAEFIGTFMLVFVGTAVAVYQQPGLSDWGTGAGLLGISFAFGGTLMVLVIAIGPVSGCHVNPAVTLAMLVAGKIKPPQAAGYMIAQVLGGIAASGLLMALLGGDAGWHTKLGLGANGNPKALLEWSLLGWEVVMTALFLMTIFSATRSGVAPIASAIAIGGFLFLAHLMGAQLGDASLNPARSIGPALLQGGEALSVLWIFIVGPFVGGLLGWGLYRLIHAD